MNSEQAEKTAGGKKLTLLLIILFAGLLVGAGLLYNRYAGGAAENLPDTAPAVNRVEAPNFTVSDADGAPVQLSDLRGKPVVVNFWASWCPPCKSEMPGFQQVWSEVGDDVHFMMIDLVDGQRETRALGEEFIAESGYRFPVYYDEGTQAGSLYGIVSIPTTLFIDAEGYIVTMAQGAIPESTLLEGISLIRS